ncbi:MAG: hypothetical protein L0922_07730, partial [Candidatus Mariimomonas ferrooxydans]
MKKGDVIKCIDNEDFAELLTVGKNYTVRGMSNLRVARIIGDDGNKCTFNECRFELITTAPVKIQKGDRFKGAETDTEYIVNGVDDNGNCTIAATTDPLRLLYTHTDSLSDPKHSTLPQPSLTPGDSTLPQPSLTPGTPHYLNHHSHRGLH